MNKRTLQTSSITDVDVASIVASWTGIPVSKLAEEESERLVNLESIIHQRVVGQEKAVEAVDVCLGRVVEKILEKDGTVFITADHGNAEQMIDFSTGDPMTAHTTDPVPFLYVSKEAAEKELRSGVLADIAPTMLQAMGLQAPTEMTGKSLIK
jgi:bisphosphoglycerate-independent phosphoglycerate mutase (AlkP superfamily)